MQIKSLRYFSVSFVNMSKQYTEILTSLCKNSKIDNSDKKIYYIQSSEIQENIVDI